MVKLSPVFQAAATASTQQLANNASQDTSWIQTITVSDVDHCALPAQKQTLQHV
jgi:hypothetical protein